MKFIIATGAVLSVIAVLAAGQFEGSGDDGTTSTPEVTRPRPLEGSGDDEVTRPRPMEPEKKPKLKKAECECYIYARTKADQKGKVETYSEEMEDMFDDEADEVDFKHEVSVEGCNEVRERCRKHCAGLQGKLFSKGLMSQLSSKKNTNVGDFLCSKLKSDNEIQTVLVYGKLDSRYCSEKQMQKRKRGERDDDDDDDDRRKYRKYNIVRAFDVEESLCCKKMSRKRYGATACATSANPDDIFG